MPMFTLDPTHDGLVAALCLGLVVLLLCILACHRKIWKPSRYSERVAVETVLNKYGLSLEELKTRAQKGNVASVGDRDASYGSASSGPYRWNDSCARPARAYHMLEEDEEAPAVKLRPTAPVAIPTRVKAAFNAFDRTHTGSISVESVKPALRQFGFDVNGPGAAAMMAKYDEGADGTLDMAEFARLVADLRDPRRQPKAKPTPKQLPRPSEPPTREPPSEAVGQPPVVGPRARHDALAEAKWAEEQAVLEARRAVKEAAEVEEAATRHVLPLTEALRERARTEHDWLECVAQVVQWDAVEEMEVRDAVSFFPRPVRACWQPKRA